MKVFGDELNPSIPYKTFVLSVKDTAEWIVKEMLEKYGLKHENSYDYCLVQVRFSFGIFFRQYSSLFLEDYDSGS